MLLFFDPQINILNASRTAVVAKSDFWLSILVWATVFVGFGVIIEAICEILEIREEYRDGKTIKLRKKIMFFGAFLVALFVGVEGVAEHQIGNKEDEIRQKNSEIEQVLINEAAEAKTSADGAVKDLTLAQTELDRISAQAAALSDKIASDSKELNKLNTNVFINRPRGELLSNPPSKFKAKLALFSGQRVKLLVCGKFGSQNGETLYTWGAIIKMLDTDGAKWKVESVDLEYFDRCSPGGGQPLGHGLMVFVSKSAPKRTLEAANALGHGLSRILPPSPNKMPGIVDPDFFKRFVQPIEGSGTPWAKVVNDPELITILIGAHPQE
jgi:hypothetical protein